MIYCNKFKKILLFTVSLAVTGCGDAVKKSPNEKSSVKTQSKTENHKSANTAAAKKKSPEYKPDPQITLVQADLKKYEAVLAKHRGKVVLVDYWATWCSSCMKAFPHTVHSSKSHKAQGLRVVSVSLDSTKKSDAALKFLNQSGARFDNLISTYSAQKTLEKHDISGGIPHLRLYDRKGKLRYKFANVEPDTLKQLEKRIEELLHEKAK